MKKIVFTFLLLTLLVSFTSCNKTETIYCPVDSNIVRVSKDSKTIEEMTNKAHYVFYANITSKEVHDDYITLEISNLEVIKGSNYEPTSIDVYYTHFERYEYGNITDEGFSLEPAYYNCRVTYDNIIKDNIKVYFYLKYNYTYEKYTLIDNLNAMHLNDEDAVNYANTYIDTGGRDYIFE